LPVRGANQEILDYGMTSDSARYDVAIVGGGPAGLTASLWLARYLHSVVLIDSGDPRNWRTRGINGFLGSPDVRPAELRGKARDECRRHGVELIDDAVDHVRKHDDEHFSLTLHDGRAVEASRILLAIGIRDIWPVIPNLERCFGESIHVCPDCDGYEARGRKVLVIGRGRKAVGMALNLTTWTDQIVVCTNGEPPDMDAELIAKLDHLNIPVLTDRILSVQAVGDVVTGVELPNGVHLDCERIFFSIAQYPADDLGQQLGCKRDDHGQIVVDDAHHTSVVNVFAAGDITPGPQLAISAASAGAISALAIHKSLVPEERKLS
jgi:thioredoxin reductase